MATPRSIIRAGFVDLSPFDTDVCGFAVVGVRFCFCGSLLQSGLDGVLRKIKHGFFVKRCHR